MTPGPDGGLAQLLDADDRAAALEQLVDRVRGAGGALTVRSLPAAWPVPASPDLAADTLTARLARAARVRVVATDPPGGTGAGVPGWAVVLREHRDRLVLADGRVAAVLALAGWPARAPLGWTGAFADAVELPGGDPGGGPELPGQALLAAHLRPLPDELAVRVLRRRATRLTSELAAGLAAGRSADPALRRAAEGADRLWADVAAGTTCALRVQLLVGVIAADRCALRRLLARLRDVARSRSALLRLLGFAQAPAWAALHPGGSPLGAPWRLLDAHSAAASLPPGRGPDPGPAVRALRGRATLVGVEGTSGAPLLCDRFDLLNPHRLVVGTSGAGKTYAAKLEVARQLARGRAVTVVDPEGEYVRFAGRAGGLAIGVGSEPSGLNPVGLAVDPVLSPAEALSVLSAFVAALTGPLDPTDTALLDRALAALRADRWSPHHTAGLADLAGVLADLVAHPPFTGSALPARLQPTEGGALASLFGVNPALRRPPPLVVFDLREVPAPARPAVISCVLAWVWSRGRGSAHPATTRRAADELVVVDEAHLLLDDPAAAALLASIARRARKYRIAVELVTQRLSDFLTGPSGRAVLACCSATLLLGCTEHERAAVRDGLGLSAAEADLLRPGRPGAGLLRGMPGPGDRAGVQVLASPEEDALCRD